MVRASMPSEITKTDSTSHNPDSQRTVMLTGMSGIRRKPT